VPDRLWDELANISRPFDPKLWQPLRDEDAKSIRAGFLALLENLLVSPYAAVLARLSGQQLWRQPLLQALTDHRPPSTMDSPTLFENMDCSQHADVRRPPATGQKMPHVCERILGMDRGGKCLSEDASKKIQNRLQEKVLGVGDKFPQPPAEHLVEAAQRHGAKLNGDPHAILVGDSLCNQIS